MADAPPVPLALLVDVVVVVEPEPPAPVGDAVHVPDLHEPFEQGAPSGFAGFEHDPLAKSHVPAS